MNVCALQCAAENPVIMRYKWTVRFDAIFVCIYQQWITNIHQLQCRLKCVWHSPTWEPHISQMIYLAVIWNSRALWRPVNYLNLRKLVNNQLAQCVANLACKRLSIGELLSPKFIINGWILSCISSTFHIPASVPFMCSTHLLSPVTRSNTCWISCSIYLFWNLYC